MQDDPDEGPACAPVSDTVPLVGNPLLAAIGPLLAKRAECNVSDFATDRLRAFAQKRYLPVDVDGWERVAIHQAALEHLELVDPAGLLAEPTKKRGRPREMIRNGSNLALMVGLQSEGWDREDAILSWVEERRRKHAAATGDQLSDIDCLRMYVAEVDDQRPGSTNFDEHVKGRQSMMLRAKKRQKLPGMARLRATINPA